MSLQDKDTKSHSVRRLVIVLGDQLSLESSAFKDFEPQLDMVWMAEAKAESTHVPSSKQRTALFLSAMRHFAQEIRDKNWPIEYTKLDNPSHTGTLRDELSKALTNHHPQEIVVTHPGDFRVLKDLENCCADLGLELKVLPDDHFFTQISDFQTHAKARKQLRMEYWYRELRKRFNILMKDGEPVGGAWNFDSDNRKSFGKSGPSLVPPAYTSEPDAITKEVIELVNREFKNHVGSLDTFAWPVNRTQALQALKLFIEERLPLFGQFEDAMWTQEPWLYHSHISSALNLKLLNPKEVVAAAENAYHAGTAPIESVEGFIRQILGWREFVRGIYWTQMPAYLELNALGAKNNLPSAFWSGQTQMNCLSETLEQTFNYGYAHHIQRLMVLGLYTLMYGVDPRYVHEWYLSVYVDAVEWVELPNTLGMSQYADGGIIASKPYIASGKYIQKMSNYCKGCKYDPAVSTGSNACPMTTLYWDFLIRHQKLLAKNPRMGMQLKNLARLDEDKIALIQSEALLHRSQNQ
jgi:deoxyribodipyrimidine photolyase-related protein